MSDLQVSDTREPTKEQLLTGLKDLQFHLATECRWNEWTIVYWTRQRLINEQREKKETIWRARLTARIKDLEKEKRDLAFSLQKEKRP